MKSVIKLFKALPISNSGTRKISKKILKKTIKKGFIFSPEVAYNYSDRELEKLIPVVAQEIGLTPKQLNNSFHKNWSKIQDAPLSKLILEQIIHYITTYGFENAGIYNEDSIYIPDEVLEIPKLKKKKLSLVVIKGLTKQDIKTKLLKLLSSGIALAEETIKCVLDIATFVEMSEDEIEQIKNKEVKVALYDYLDKFPQNPIEFLMYLIYKSINKTLLIKDRQTIEEIKTKDNLNVLRLLQKYNKKYGLNNLATIFYRFKPLFLAFRTNSGIRKITNQIRRLANYHHKPMPKDYLNSLTAKIKNGEQILETDLVKALDRVNVFRKVRLANALKFRMNDPKSIVYKIRNGKGFATNFNKLPNVVIDNTLYQSYNIILNSICQNISEEIKKSTIYIPEYIQYALPTSEKQFTGNFPLGTCITTPKDMIVGVHWENQKGHRVDLDLSMINMKIGKIGWDSSYRTQDRAILFSGDMTNASLPNGASELFYVKIQNPSSFLLDLNYFNYSENMNVPFKIIVAQQKTKNITKNYAVNPNNVLTTVKTKIDKKQKTLGLLVVQPDYCKFYFAEINIGNKITASNSPVTEHSRQYLYDFCTNMVGFHEVFSHMNIKLTSNKDKCVIDLSPECIDKNSLLQILEK